MNKIIILYYSGVGNTETVAKYINNYLKKNNSVDNYSIEELPMDFSFSSYSKIIFGFPTIHSTVASPMMDFIKNLNGLSKKLPAFVYTTCGLYSANSIRTFCKSIISKNIVPIYTSSYQCPATDGILLTPRIKRWYRYEQGLSFRIKVDLEKFLNMGEVKSQIPVLKWYSVVNYPNKVLGKLMKFKIYLHKKRCVGCGLCIKKCPAKACTKDEKNGPLMNTKKCINCYRCIHHCSQRALSLSRRRAPKKTLESQSWQTLRS